MESHYFLSIGGFSVYFVYRNRLLLGGRERSSSFQSAKRIWGYRERFSMARLIMVFGSRIRRFTDQAQMATAGWGTASW